MTLDLNAAKLVADRPENAPDFQSWLDSLHAAFNAQLADRVRDARREAFREMRDFCNANGFTFPVKFDKEAR